MKKRIVSAFSLVCATALLCDFCADHSYTSATNTDTKSETVATAGAVSVASVDLSSLEELSLTDSNAVATAKSLGDIYG